MGKRQRVKGEGGVCVGGGGDGESGRGHREGRGGVGSGIKLNEKP